MKNSLELIKLFSINKVSLLLGSTSFWFRFLEHRNLRDNVALLGFKVSAVNFNKTMIRKVDLLLSVQEGITRLVIGFIITRPGTIEITRCPVRIHSGRFCI